MIDVTAIAVFLTRAWTVFYTIGLGAEVKEGRRAEIESDLWDQQRLASLQGEAHLQTASHVFMRFFLGIPADCFWRTEAIFAARKEGKSQVPENWMSRVGLLAGVLPALFPIMFGLGVLAGSGDWSSTAQRVIWGAVWIITGFLMAAGMLLVRRTYGGGMTLMAIGVVGFCLSTFWMAFITAPIGIVLLVLAHLRGRVTDSPAGTGAA